MSAFAVFSGTGTVTTRLSAYSLSLKFAFSLTLTSSRVRPSSFTIGSTLNGRLMPSCSPHDPVHCQMPTASSDGQAHEPLMRKLPC